MLSRRLTLQKHFYLEGNKWKAGELSSALRRSRVSACKEWQWQSSALPALYESKEHASHACSGSKLQASLLQGVIPRGALKASNDSWRVRHCGIATKLVLKAHLNHSSTGPHDMPEQRLASTPQACGIFQTVVALKTMAPRVFCLLTAGQHPGSSPWPLPFVLEASEHH